jgi:hypothetical protein
VANSVSKSIGGLGAGSTANLFLISVPADWVGKVVMLNIAGTINGVTMGSGTSANINLIVQTTNMDSASGNFGNNFVLNSVGDNKFYYWNNTLVCVPLNANIGYLVAQNNATSGGNLGLTCVLTNVNITLLDNSLTFPTTIMSPA